MQLVKIKGVDQKVEGETFEDVRPSTPIGLATLFSGCRIG